MSQIKDFNKTVFLVMSVHYGRESSEAFSQLDLLLLERYI